MNWKQKFVVVLGAVVVVLLALFPPWYLPLPDPKVADYFEGAPPRKFTPVLGGPRWAFAPRENRDGDWAWSRPAHEAAVSFQLAVLALTAGAVVVFGDRKSAASKDE